MRCRIDSKIADGGLSKVFRGFDIDGQRPIAIKVYRCEGGEFDFSEIEANEYLTNSLRTHGHLDPTSRRFPTLYGHADKTLIMEFVEGANLRNLGQSFIGEDGLVLIAGYQIALCLNDFHRSRPEKPIIHRDIKPSNVIVRPTGESVLCDFDLTYIDEKSVDGIERIRGTPQFLSPEQAGCQPVLPISDLFSLGSSLYLLFAGRALSDGCYTALHIEEFAPSFDLGRGDVKEVIETCWRIDRTYESAEHMVVELADRLRKIGIDPEKSHEVLAGFVKRSHLQ